MAACISPLTVRHGYQLDTVPCGRCLFCLQRKRADWSFRLYCELREAVTAHFLTLTYELEPQDGLVKRDIQLFLKKLRKRQSCYSNKSLRYFAVGEYGTRTNRAHYHIILFNLMPNLVDEISQVWSHGHVLVGTVTPASIHYVTKYVINKIDADSNKAPPFSLMSRRPGLGHVYLEKFRAWHRDDMRTYAVINAHKIALPRYFKEKIFSKSELRMLSEKAITQCDELYAKEIERLTRLHHDPLNYYDERLQFVHDNVLQQLNKTNKF